MGKSSSSPAPPTAGETYGQTLTTYASPAAQQARLTASAQDLALQDVTSRAALQQQLAYQAQFTPQVLEQQLALERQLQPSLDAAQQERLQAQNAMAAGMIPSLRATVDPRLNAILETYGKQVEEDLAAGGRLTPGMARDAEQNIRSAQSARGVVRGAGAANQEALVKGLQAEQLKSQRQQAAQSFMQTLQQVQPNALAQVQGSARELQPAQQQPVQGYEAVTSQLMPLVAQQQATAYNYAAAQNAQPSRGQSMIAAIGGLLGAGAGALR